MAKDVGEITDVHQAGSIWPCQVGPYAQPTKAGRQNFLAEEMDFETSRWKPRAGEFNAGRMPLAISMRTT